MISTRSVGLLIDTVVCLTLAKWVTVSGRFWGYLSFLLQHSSRLWRFLTLRHRQSVTLQSPRTPLGSEVSREVSRIKDLRFQYIKDERDTSSPIENAKCPAQDVGLEIARLVCVVFRSRVT